MGGKVIWARVVLYGFLLVLGVAAWQARSADGSGGPPKADPDARQVIYGVEGGTRAMVELFDRRPRSVYLVLDEVCGDRAVGATWVWAHDTLGELERDGRRFRGTSERVLGSYGRERVATVSFEGELREDLSGAEGTATSRMTWWIDGVKAGECAPRTVRWRVARPKPVD